MMPDTCAADTNASSIFLDTDEAFFLEVIPDSL
jgi:hypothetical protein